MIGIESSKVSAEHLRREAYLYVRQSTLHQVFSNTESTKRQYDLRRRAVALGWPDDRVVVIDSDLGQSGASAADREGFQRLMAETANGRAGIVMGLEVSRLARNCSDWHRLLEICALTGTLILDEDGIYDPAHFNDRLLLGLKGTMSEAELHMLRARMQGGYIAKARRGELRLRLPVGFVYDAAGKVRLDPDRQVQDTIEALFDTFSRKGSAGAVVRTFHEQGWSFPVRPPHGPRMGELLWQPLTYTRALNVLRNPRYAGAYVLGRTRTRKLGNGGRGSSKTVPRDQWQVLLPEAHASYISWEQYEENMRRLRDNNTCTRSEGIAPPPREGTALLQGLVLCGACGRRMQVRYSNRKEGLAPAYDCPRGREPWTSDHCQFIPGRGIDEAVSRLVVEAMSPMALEATLAIHQELQARSEQADRLRREQVERARHEAEAARRRYMLVDPDNRLVADALEGEWNEKLKAYTQQQQDYERQREAEDLLVTKERRDRIVALATDFPVVWAAPTTTARDRKRMLRLLVEDVTLLRHKESVDVHVRFRGGGTRSLALPRPLASWESWATPPEVLRRIDALLEAHDNAEIARILNAEGFQSGRCRRFNAENVKAVIRRNGLESLYGRLRERGLLTEQEVAERAGVSPGTVQKWRRAGRLRFHAYDRRGGFLYDVRGGIPGRLAPTRNPTGRNGRDRNEEVQYEL